MSFDTGMFLAIVANFTTLDLVGMAVISLKKSNLSAVVGAPDVELKKNCLKTAQ